MIKTSRRFLSLNFISKTDVDFYNKNGYAVLKNVFSNEQIQKVKDEMANLISKEDPNKLNTIFKAGTNFTADYFLKSGDNVSFFLEDGSYDENGKLKYELKDCINKAGHGMHDFNQVFKDFSYSKEIKHIMKTIGYVEPMIVQSMYIMKTKRIGGEVTPHTDNTYIRSNPLSCMGIWIALDDAYIENGAMYGVPGSHKNKTDYFMKLATNPDGTQKTIYNKEKQDYSTEGAVSLEAKKGTVILLHGDFVHFSYKNSSDKERHAYTLHLVEGKKGYDWEKDNWLQRKVPFSKIKL